jgi:DNA segregation ATPase FtsK/SpoIIIE, S-DNA-T family
MNTIALFIALISGLFALGVFVFLRRILHCLKNIETSLSVREETLNEYFGSLTAKQNQHYTDILTELKGMPDQLRTMGDDIIEAHAENLYEDARAIVIESGKASASFLQRRFNIGYATAAQLLDTMEEEGVVGPANGAKPRMILVTRSQKRPGL